MPSNTSSESRDVPMGWKYTSRLQKGGALLEDMRELVRTWQDGPLEDQRQAGIRSNVLNKATRTRLADIYRRAFLPRFVHGPIPGAWKLVRPLEDLGAPVSIVRPLYYWITAHAEPLLRDFCREVLRERIFGPQTIGTEDVLGWFREKGCPWSLDVSTKVARGLLAALRDFGILEGHGRKRIAPSPLPLASFSYLAFCLCMHGARGRWLQDHPDWQLFLLLPDSIERSFLQAHQAGFLTYHAAGSVVSVDFPATSLEEYARVVLS